MENQSPRFTFMSVDPVPVSKETALKREKEHVERYQRNHRGRKPRYNKRPLIIGNTFKKIAHANCECDLHKIKTAGEDPLIKITR